MTLLGRLVILGGAHALADRKVALFATRITDDGGHDHGARPELLVTVMTDSDGHFVASMPEGRFLDAFALLDDGTGRHDIDLLADGTFPDEIVIVLTGLPSHLRFAGG